MGFQMAGPGCCCAECVIFEDGFDRDDSSSLGTNWTETSGEWEIVTNALEVDAGDSILLYSGAFTETYFNLLAVINADTVADEARLIFAYEDSSNYWYAQARIDTDLVFVSIWQVAGGTPTNMTGELSQKASTTEYGASDDFILRVCYSSGRLIVNVIGGTDPTGEVGIGIVHLLSGALPAGDVGLGTGDQTGTIRFLSFTFEKNFAEETACPFCTSDCYLEHDDFDRADDSDPGANYDVRTGTFAIASNVLTTTSSTSVAVTVDESPTTKQVVRMKVSHSAYTVVSRLIVSWIDDDNFVFVELFESSDRLTLFARVYKRSGGTDTLQSTQSRTKTAIQTTFYVQACVSGNGFIVGISFIGYDNFLVINLGLAITGMTGVKAGIGTRSSTGTATFEEFQFLRHYSDTSGCPACPPACGNCTEEYPPFVEYVADLGAFGLTDGQCGYCDQITGEWTLTNTSATGCTWEYRDCDVCSLTEVDPNCSDRVHLYITMIISNVGGGNIKFQVTIMLYAATGTDPNCTTVAPACGASERKAVYESGSISKTGDVCQDMPLTLDLVSDSFNDEPGGRAAWCNGTAPATITLEAA